eukprot:6091015-Alexandrium_andersonii.AAC.1
MPVEAGSRPLATISPTLTWPPPEAQGALPPALGTATPVGQDPYGGLGTPALADVHIRDAGT